MSYCDQSDVVILKGDFTIPKSVDIDEFIDRAERDIDVALSSRYIVPITSTEPQAMNLLKSITADLACGRLILSMSVASEDNSLQSYGKSLVNRAINGDAVDGTRGLKDLREGSYALPGAGLKAGVTSTSRFNIRINSPKISGEDKSYYDYLYKDFR
jgi:hypothetical protein